MKTCFVIMPISDHNDYDRGHFTVVYNHVIKKACEEAGYKAVRADDFSDSSDIVEGVLNQIANADMAVCDLSSRNPNVMYELGLRMALGKPVLIIKDDQTKAAFDIQNIRHTPYNSSLRADFVEKSINEISQSITSTYENRDGISKSFLRMLAPQVDASVSPTASVDERDARPQQLQGVVTKWGPSYGEIESSGECFYVNKKFLAQSDELKIGDHVFFIAQRGVDGRNRAAAAVVGIGYQVSGTIVNSIPSKNCAFATIIDSLGNTQTIYMGISGEEDYLERGTEVVFDIGRNPQGAKAIEVVKV
ncbi:nucleoside 2-deoxyribosyltransferase [Vibrio cholerae]|uniref:nucleoside 2-deoxyribosyltransferase n=1 Tax=Vibrio cholerae TaxID=666 RepID=UPI00215D1A60|nr:nucleoside 2-deoxyribosyltransferase [Vibrio cholerae]MCR9700337.1 nucleoside 2-deoxyribosyltransferase [Vibrio cholerae]HDZ3742425.1 hypothetical protein [Vibrio cholerae]HDZ3764140.1 hypothetical protein [Vibrio cholerae]